MRTYPRVALAAVIALGACAQPQPDPALSRIVVAPDRPEKPRSVRFDVPTAFLVSLPGARVPPTLEARLSTREIAAHELAARGYCPRGFTGPEGVSFPGGDRSRASCVVHCTD